MKQTLRVEFHCHTIYSQDCLVKPSHLVKSCRGKGIDRVVITDHNTISGALEAKSIDPERVIVGEEIMTENGELLAAFLKDPVPPGLPVMEAIARLRVQGAFISVSHPFDNTRRGSWNRTDLEMIAPLVDAIETFNSRCLSSRMNQQAQEFARNRNLQATVGSDAHTAYELGKAIMEMPCFEDAETFQRSLGRAKLQVSSSPFWIRLSSRYAVVRKKLTRL